MAILGNYIEEYSVRNKNNKPLNVYSVTNSQGFCSEYFDKDVSGEDKTTYKIVPKGYFAYNPSRINVGSVDWQNKEDEVIVSPLYNVFKCKNGLRQEYLKEFLRSSYGKQLINNNTSGSVRANLKISELSKFRLNIPSEDEQDKLLEKIYLIKDAIRNEENIISILEELVKARFIEMFGDINEIGRWQRKPWNDLLKIQNGRDYKHILVEQGGYPVYGTGGEMARASDYLCPENTVIVGRKGTINNPLLVKEKFWNVDTAFGVIPGEEIHYQYLYNFCRMFDFEKLNKAAVLPSTTKGDLLKIEMNVPPICLQNDFASFVEQIDKSKFICQQKIKLYQELLDKKMDEYFNPKEA